MCGPYHDTIIVGCTKANSKRAGSAPPVGGPVPKSVLHVSGCEGNTDIAKSSVAPTVVVATQKGQELPPPVGGAARAGLRATVVVASPYIAKGWN